MSLSDKHILVSGATSGIGLAAGCALARAGAHLTLVARDPDRGATALAQVREAGPNAEHQVLEMDFASLGSVREAGREFLMAGRPLDILVNNAGVINKERRLTEDGFEETFAVNHLAPFLLTGLLMPALSEGSRIINVASGAHDFVRGINFDDINSQGSYKTFKVYGQSKLANILFTVELSRRLEKKGISCNSLHPGAVATNIGKQNEGLAARLLPLILKPFFKTPIEGAATILYLCQSPEIDTMTGRYFIDCKPAEPKPWAMDVPVARRLWTLSEEMTGFTYAS